RDLLGRKFLQERVEDAARLQWVSHPDRVAQRKLGATEVAKLLRDADGALHVHRAFVRTTPYAAQVRADRQTGLSREGHDLAELLQRLRDRLVGVLLVMRLRRRHEDGEFLHSRGDGPLEPRAIRD